jgi:hypothetical protein
MYKTVIDDAVDYHATPLLSSIVPFRINTVRNENDDLMFAYTLKVEQVEMPNQSYSSLILMPTLIPHYGRTFLTPSLSRNCIAGLKLLFSIMRLSHFQVITIIGLLPFQFYQGRMSRCSRNI